MTPGPQQRAGLRPPCPLPALLAAFPDSVHMATTQGGPGWKDYRALSHCRTESGRVTGEKQAFSPGGGS